MKAAARFAALAFAAAVLSLGFWTRARLAGRGGAAPSSTEGLSFRLTEESSRAGRSYVPGRFVPHASLANLAPRLGSLGVSVAVVDFDGDGWPDVFVSNRRAAARTGSSAQA